MASEQDELQELADLEELDRLEKLDAASKGGRSDANLRQMTQPYGLPGAVAEEILAPIATGFADVGTLGLASKLSPEFEAARKVMAERHPRLYGLGQMAPQAVALPETAAGRMTQAVAVPSIHAAVTGADPREAGKAGLIGGLIGEVIPGAAGAAQRGLENVAERNAARALGFNQSEISRLAKGADIEATNRAREVGRWALDKGVIGPSTGGMVERATAIGQEAGQGIGKTLGALEGAGLKTGMTAPELESRILSNPEIMDYLNLSSRRTGRAPVSDVLETIGQIQPNPRQQISFPEMQKMKEEAGFRAYPGGVGTERTEGAQGVYTEINKALEGEVESGLKQNPQLADFEEYLQNKENYKRSGEALHALGRKFKGELGNNQVSLSGVIAGAGAPGGLPAKAATMVGAQSVREIWNPGTALIADKIAKIMGSPYAGVMKEALQRGAQSFAATDFILQQTDPNYRTMVTGDENQETSGREKGQ